MLKLGITEEVVIGRYGLIRSFWLSCAIEKVQKP